MQLRTETEAALAAVEIGLGLSRGRIGADQIQSKGGRDLVTATDIAVEDAIRAALLERYPAWTVVGEERGGEDQIGDRPYWLLDPICGTRNVACNLPLYSINLAFVENGQPTIAIFNIVSPVHTTAGCLLAAEDGALVSDITGRPWTLDTRQLLTAATPELQADLLDLSKLPELVKFAKHIEDAVLETIESGTMTKDLALIAEPRPAGHVSTEGFIQAIAERLRAKMSSGALAG